MKEEKEFTHGYGNPGFEDIHFNIEFPPKPQKHYGPKKPKISGLYPTFIILSCFYILQLVREYIFYEYPYTLDYIASALGVFPILIPLPLIVAILAKVFKKQFFSVFWKALLWISVPMYLLSLVGQYYE